jgi:DNA-binding FadR family transcriptional regulator
MASSPWQEIAARERGSLASRVANSLEEMIQGGQFQIGDKLPTESALGDMFDVSRTVVREAVSHLKSLGLVETRRGVGAFVVRRHSGVSSMIQGLSHRTVNEILNILEFRMAVEVEAASLAAHRRTTKDMEAMQINIERFAAGVKGADFAKQEDFEFHRLIGNSCKNPVYIRFYDSFGLAMVPRTHIADLSERLEISRYLEQVLAEHCEIYQCILNQDAEGAKTAMRRHLHRSYKLYQTRAEV